MTANQPEIAKRVAALTGMSQVVSKTVFSATCQAIADLLREGYDVSLHGVGKIKLKMQEERNCRNPKTGETFVSPAHPVIRFKPCSTLKKDITSMDSIPYGDDDEADVEDDED